MLSKKDYLIYFVRLFFSSLLLIICSLITYLWNTYQPLDLIIQIQQCQIPKCQSYIQNDYALDIYQLIKYLYSIALIYFIYHLICLLFFHRHFKEIQEKQHFYARLYLQDQKSRCSKRLFKT